MARLGKSQAEALMNAIDSDTLGDMLKLALQTLLGAADEVVWSDLVRLAGSSSGWSPDRVEGLARSDVHELQQLAAQLNELREL